MNKRARKKLQRSAQLLTPQYAPGGATMYVPPGYAQSLLGQTYYGSSMKNVPVGQSALFSPGLPLPTQPNVNPQGLPVQFKYMPAYNTFPVDRTMGQPDIPSFEQLRRLAKMYSGIGLCERYWMDLVPRMTLDIKLKKVFADAGAEEKNYQKEIAFFKNFFAKPDGKNDLHTWIRKALREQTQIDELYLYKNRTRGRKLLGLWIVDGAQMKPLMDDWGMQPDAPAYAYQQYPWGIPGMMYSTDQMIHYQESPAADTPYGFSRVERIILEVNQALRKKKKDLAYFTEGNQPFSLMEVPESLNWTPDQIDAYEQSWNALIAGNAQQQVRTKFTQPGMKYIPVEQYQLMTDFDKFILNVCVATYGISMAELSFTEDVNRSTGESQEDMTYRRTIGPLAAMYGMILTDVMANDFPPEMHGEMFEACFGGYEEIEDESQKASALTTYTNAGVLGLTDAAKMANLPIDPNAPPIGRVFFSKDGPIFLDDMASDKMRNAAIQAKMAGFQLAANPQEPASKAPEDDEETPPANKKTAENMPKASQSSDEKTTLSRVSEALANIDEQLRLLRAVNVTPEPMVSQQGTCDCEMCRGMAGQPTSNQQPPYHEGCDCSAVKGSEYVERAQKKPEVTSRISGDSRRAISSDARAAAQPDTGHHGAPGPDPKEISAEFRRWREVALKDVKAGKPVRHFISEVIPHEQQEALRWSLSLCRTPEAVRAVFPVFHEQSQERDTSFFVQAASSNGGNLQPNRSTWKLRW